MSRTEADKIITRKVRTMLARGEPLDHLLDDYVCAEMIGDFPAIGFFLPRDRETFYNNYVLRIDMETTQELRDFMKKLPGKINVSMDGATVNGKQKIVYTVSRAEYSVFVDWTDLGSTKHQTAAEITDAHQICTEAEATYGAKVASIPFDNAERGVANAVCSLLGGSVSTSRDPAHCVDLLSKDLASTPVVQSVMAEAKEVRDFVKTDRIDSIRVESNQASHDSEFVPTAVKMSDTRMNLWYDYIKASRKQHGFVKLLWGNDLFRAYYE
mmetsp:Transcript_14219/g.30950  ORF Transcript_14219/g.30950 Transcript_14219/m.30950 type:complete len:269 (+) Transcript_14219:140-946(+)